MKVQRYCGFDKKGLPNKIDFRLFSTTCPKCHQNVEFALLDEDFMREDNEFLREQNMAFRGEIHRLNKIINKIIEKDF